jgi:cation transport ATPase
MKRKSDNVNTGTDIQADICSRPNALNGRYKAGQLGLGLDDLGTIRNDDIFFLETMKMKADLADKMIAEAESQGKDTTDPNVMKDLGEQINALGTPIHRSQSIMSAIFVSLQSMAYCGIAIGIWGLVFKKSFLRFSFYGVIAGLLISLTCAPVVAFQRTKERIRIIVDGASGLWGPVVIIISIVGLIAWGIRLILF